jgi:hypothetical protein
MASYAAKAPEGFMLYIYLSVAQLAINESGETFIRLIFVGEVQKCVKILVKCIGFLFVTVTANFLCSP